MQLLLQAQHLCQHKLPAASGPIFADVLLKCIQVSQLVFSVITSLAIMQVRDSLTARAKEFNIFVDDIAITHLSFGTEVRMIQLTERLLWDYLSCTVHSAAISAVL